MDKEKKKKKRIGKSALKVRKLLEEAETMHRTDYFLLINDATVAAQNLAEGKPPGTRVDHVASVIVYGAGRVQGLREAYAALVGEEGAKEFFGEMDLLLVGHVLKTDVEGGTADGDAEAGDGG
ncbi:MAG: hypothetical protein KAJ19_20720 [Gammaproteobacteria bacterium]|nr:hypothetical protein [Gammaproteobacteria bacterium]